MQIDKLPPIHMPICSGPVISKKITNEIKDKPGSPEALICQLCSQFIENKKMSCLNPNCGLVSHVICLSVHFLDKNEYVPIEGKCPRCNENYLWGDIVRKFKGCYNDLNIKISTENANDFYSSDSE